MKAEQETRADWLPVVEFNGVEYVVDVENRRFGQFDDPDSGVEFHSDRGREMARAMIGRQWRAFTPRDLWENRDEQVV
jgi:hypothetical protein